MNIADIFASLLAGQDAFYKIVLVIFMLLYSLFALILSIQIRSLIQVIDQIHFSSILKFLALANIVASILLILYTILTL